MRRAVIALCHFCDQHGPSVLMNTRAQIKSNVLQDIKSSIMSSDSPAMCNACELDGEFVSVDELTQVQYISCHLPTQMPHLTAWLQHISIRSLSCEVNPCLSSVQENCVMSVSFSVRDAMSRGFYSWYSIVITMRDLTLLAASWNYLYLIINKIIKRIQDKALVVYNEERPLRFNNPPQSRSLIELTRDKNIFMWLHSWFSLLLRVESKYFLEQLPRSPYFYVKPDINIENGDLRTLRCYLTNNVFIRVVLGLIEGKQIIVRGDVPSLVEDTINNLKLLIPDTCCKYMVNADEYIEATKCNLLGVSTQVAVPRPAEDILRIDILNGCFLFKGLGVAPSKYPTLLNKLIKALDNPILNNKALVYYITALKQEWINNSILLCNTHSSSSDLLTMTLGIQEQDKQLILFWSKGV